MLKEIVTNFDMLVNYRKPITSMLQLLPQIIFLMCITLPETNSSHMKMDGWKDSFTFWEGLLSGAMLLSGRVFQKDIDKPPVGVFF